MDTHFLLAVETYLRESSMSAFAFGYRSIRNGRLVNRLRAGGRIWPETAERVRAFMRDNPPELCRAKRGRRPKAKPQAEGQTETEREGG